MRVRIRRFGTLRFPKQADLSAVACSSAIVLVPRFAVLSGCTLFSSESSADLRGHLWSTTEIHSIRSPFRSALRIGAVHRPRSPPLLWPLLTSRSAVNHFPRRHPFRHEARSPQVRLIGCPCTSAGFTWLPLIARALRSYARSPWSAPPYIRFLFVAPQVSLHRFFQRRSHDCRLVVHSGCCDQLPKGLPPLSRWSCWAHIIAAAGPPRRP